MQDGQFAIPLEDEISWTEESSSELASNTSTTVNAA